MLAQQLGGLIKMTWFGRGFGRGPLGRKVTLTPLEFLILVSLQNEDPRTAKEIIDELSETFEGIWIPKTGTIYPILSRLYQNKLIEHAGDDAYRKKYSLTKKGLEFLRKSMENFQKEVYFFENFEQFVEPALKNFPPFPKAPPIPPIPPILRRLRKRREKFDTIMLQKYQEWLEAELADVNAILSKKS